MLPLTRPRLPGEKGVRRGTLSTITPLPPPPLLAMEANRKAEGQLR